MDAVRAADGRRELVLEGAALERGQQLVDVGDQKVGGAHELHVEAGVEHVGRGHALVHEARLRADDLGQMGEEGDDVVLDLALDRVDALDVEGGVLALGPDRRRRLLRDDAELGHGVGGMRLDLEPDAEARLRLPDRGHLGAGVARDHADASFADCATGLADRGALNNCARLCNAGGAERITGTAMKLLQIVPRSGTRLYGAMVRKQADIRKSGRGTFSRVGRRKQNAARWTHVRYKGSIDLDGKSADGVSVAIRSPEKGDEARLLSSFLGWLDRHFGDQVSSVNIEYRPRGRR